MNLEREGKTFKTLCLPQYQKDFDKINIDKNQELIVIENENTEVVGTLH